ncbi:MAG: ATP-binding protein [Actinomycetota bacterium]
MVTKPAARTVSASPELQSLMRGLLVANPVIFAVTVAIAYRPSFDGPADIALAVLPAVVFVATMTALLAPVWNLSVPVYQAAIVVSISGWAVLMFDNETWLLLTFALFSVCFGAGPRLGIVLSGVVAVVWSLAWAVSDRPSWLLLIPLAVFAAGSMTASTIWRVESTKEVMRRNRELESAYLAQEVTLRQKDKLATLGRLSAGMAHELNNPTAAAQQAVRQLSSLLADAELVDAELAGLGLTEGEADIVRGVTDRIDDQIDRPEFLDPLERSDRVAEIQEHLERVGVDDAWEVAPSLVDLGLSVDELSTLAEQVRPDRLAPAITLVAAQHSRASLIRSIDESTARIIELVRALKSYAYLDQAPRQLVDVHEGLDSTLVMLQHRLKTGVEVRRTYPDDLPEIEAYGGELNQVWTNILDNAIDAMDGHGAIEIATCRAGDHVVVELTDNGPGVPSTVADNIFDPFVTTKPPGEGTGLGLNIAHNIITRKHGGEITLTSEPGRTTFTIRLPITAPAELDNDNERDV